MPEPLWRVFFLNTGDGEAIYIEKADCAFNLLLDGGLADPTLGGRYPYRYAISDFLRERAVGRLDILVASHFHADHVGGLAAVVDSLPVGEFWYGYPPYEAALALEIAAGPGWSREAVMMIGALGIYRRLLERVRARGIPERRLAAGAEYAYAGYACRLTCLYPEAKAAAVIGYDRLLRQLAERPDEAGLAAGMKTMNAISLALAVDLSGCRLLLPADLPVSLFGPRAFGKYDLLKLAHHGGADGVDEDLLRRLKPGRVVISAAHDSSEFPHPATRDLLARLGVQVHYTDDQPRRYLEFAITEKGCHLASGH